ncbi:MAG TPA: transcriptional regulator [Microbacterium sp.]|uniref:helix-turn-helix domain-containing protein n=1 Tax=Microbacterium sp. TaxID=51671 RepID=UPI000ECDEA40|nr:transcriptional regulator [Microbacterium sp.]
MFTATLRSSADIGAAIQQARLATEMTQRELAERIGVSQRYIWELESGKDVAAITRLLSALEATGARLYVEVPEGDLDA